MDPNDVAAQQQMGAIAAQRMMCGLSDRPEQFREPPMWRLMQQCERERTRGDSGMDYMHVPF